MTALPAAPLWAGLRVQQARSLPVAADYPVAWRTVAAQRAVSLGAEVRTGLVLVQPPHATSQTVPPVPSDAPLGVTDNGSWVIPSCRSFVRPNGGGAHARHTGRVKPLFGTHSVVDQT